MCQRACRSGLSPACWAGRHTVPKVRPSRSCSGRVVWHRAHPEPSRGPHPFPGGSEVSRCFSSGHCPPGRGREPGPGYWHHRCAHGRSDSLRGWPWSPLSPGFPGSTSRCGVGSLQRQDFRSVLRDQGALCSHKGAKPLARTKYLVGHWCPKMLCRK